MGKSYFFDEEDNQDSSTDDFPGIIYNDDPKMEWDHHYRWFTIWL